MAHPHCKIANHCPNSSVIIIDKPWETHTSIIAPPQKDTEIKLIVKIVVIVFLGQVLGGEL